MSRYFTEFPGMKYDNIPVRDITRRVNFIKHNLSDPFLFLPYTTKSSERPEDVAYYYYGSMSYTWSVLLANNILDPYHEWHMTDDIFNSYLIKKYAEQSGKSGYEVIEWTQNNTITENILYYYRYLGPEEGNLMEKVSLDTLEILVNPEVYIPYRIYDMEFDSNENRREIRLIDKKYIGNVAKEFKNIMGNRKNGR